MADPERHGIRSLLRRGPFRRLLVGQAISSVGDWVGTVAFIAAAFDLTGSATAVGGVLVLRLLPPVLAAPLGGMLADRFERRRLMVIANVGMGLLIILVPFVNLALLYVLAFVSESLALVFLPARDATIPDLVPRPALATANGLIIGSSYGSIPVAAALFSGLRLLSGNLPGWFPLRGLFADYPLAFPFFFDALTFFVAAGLIAGLPRGRERIEGLPGVFEGLGDALRFARRTPAVRGLATGVGVAMFGGGVLFSLGIAYVRDTLGGGDVEFGFLVALWGLGMATGIGLAQLLVRRGEAYVFQSAVAVCGGVLLTMAFLPFTWLALVSALVFGMAFSVAVLLAITLVQRIADEEMRGRLIGGAHMLFRVSLALGALGVGGIVSGLSPVSFRVGAVGVRFDENQLGLVIGGALIVAGAVASRSVVEAPAAD
jgi:MFS family permease